MSLADRSLVTIPTVPPNRVGPDKGMDRVYAVFGGGSVRVGAVLTPSFSRTGCHCPSGGLGWFWVFTWGVSGRDVYKMGEDCSKRRQGE